MAYVVLHRGVRDTPEARELVELCRKNGVRVVRA
jgi:hypothetical protein